ncbi:hypothetical protein B7P43_G01212, partial [Cryptotermes secundus]
LLIRDVVFGIGTGYGLDDRGVGVRVPRGSRIFTSPIVQTGSGVHPTSYPMGTGGKAHKMQRITSAFTFLQRYQSSRRISQ